MNENETTKEIYEEQPREKLGRLGPEALTDKELITLIIGSGGGGRKAEDIAEELLSYLDKNPNTRLNELRYIPGMGAAKASAIIAAMELGRRKITQKPRTINCPMDLLPGKSVPVISIRMGTQRLPMNWQSALSRWRR